MKKILYIAAAVAATVACSKNIETTTQEIDNPNAFVKGQKVTLTVGTGNQTKVSSELVTTGEDKDQVNFKWEADDAIKVTVGTESATFTVSKLINGGVSAEFTGEMPAGGESFDVQYPVEEPDLSTQTYSSSEAIPHDKMKFTASGCTVGTDFNLTAVNAALRLNLYGTDVKVKQIYVSGHDSEWENELSCTLSIDEAAAISSNSSSPTPFFIVVPPGEWEFYAIVNGESASTPSLPNYPSDATPNYGPGIPITAGVCSTTSAKTFTAGVCLNMNAFPVITAIWAPVNCGYEPKTGDSGAALGYPYGKLYQWGRKDGQGYYKAGSGSTPTYEDATYPSGTNIVTGPISDIPTDSDDEKFYKSSADPYNWYSGSSPAANDLWKEDGSSIYDPCPDGWRVPSEAELTALIGNPTYRALQDGSGVHSGMKGKYFDGSTAATPTSGVFLPAAGCRSYVSGSAGDRGGRGYYWASSVDDNTASYLYLDYVESTMVGNGRALGCSVRCVQK